ncbi:hypothetical protein BGZ83_005597 [Gryganskiella cystojenkinii]|nr:hypothetical protein BGZ83_005597 [Gryganskiella cystojenkinii]
MSYLDKKQPLGSDWGAPVDEQQTFGSQAPYANNPSSSSSAAVHEDNIVDDDDAAPFLPHPQQDNLGQIPSFQPSLERPSVPMHLPMDAPPMYTPKATVATPQPPQPPVSSVAPRHPQERYPASPAAPSVPQGPQQYPYQQAPPAPPANGTPHAAQPLLHHQPPLPQQPPTQQPYQPYDQQSPVPVNYGAINTPYPNTAYVPVPRGPPRHDDSDSEEEVPIRRRKRKTKSKKSGSCCSCCCITLLVIIAICWYLAGSFGGVFDGSCWVPANAASEIRTHIIETTPDVELWLQVTDAIVGNVEVREVMSQERNIQVKMTMRATSTQLLDQMTFTNKTDSTKSYLNQHMTVHLKAKSPEEKRRYMTNNCAQVDVEVIYPLGLKRKPLVTAGRLGFGISTGQINVVMSGETAGTASTILDTFHAQMKNGEVNIQQLSAAKLTKLELANGHIYGFLATSGKIEAESLNGPIDLGIDTTPLQSGWNAEDFYVDAVAMSGRITINLAKAFHGHFDLSSAVGKPALWVQPGHDDTIQYTNNKEWNKLQGWVQHGHEPEPQGKTPRVDLKTLNGGVKLYVQKQG